MDGSLVIMEGSLVIMEGRILSRFFLLQWIVALSYGRKFVVEIFFTPMDCSLVIMEGRLLSISLLLQWMVALSLWKVVCHRDFCYYNGL